MNKGSYFFRIGNFECTVIHDGIFFTPQVKLKHSVALYNQMHPGKMMDVNILLVRTGKQTILCDTGFGVGEQPVSGNLPQNLQFLGIQYNEVDTIILSHGHGDHIGGITDEKGKPVFPNARYIMTREEWEFWTSDPNLENLDDEEEKRQMFAKCIQNNLVPVKNRMEFIDDNAEIIPGIELIKNPGHTPGSIVMVVSSNDEKLIGIFDMIHQPSDLEHPELYNVFDIDPEQGSVNRIKMLSSFISENPLVFTCHFPFPGVGHIVPEGNAWCWRPI